MFHFLSENPVVCRVPVCEGEEADDQDRQGPICCELAVGRSRYELTSPAEDHFHVRRSLSHDTRYRPLTPVSWPCCSSTPCSEWSESPKRVRLPPFLDLYPYSPQAPPPRPSRRWPTSAPRPTSAFLLFPRLPRQCPRPCSARADASAARRFYAQRNRKSFLAPCVDQSSPQCTSRARRSSSR